MNFLLSDEQRQLFDTVQRFARESNGGGHARRAMDEDTDFDKDLWQGLMSLGLGALTVSEADDGAGLEMIDLAIVCEALGREAMPGPYIGHFLAIYAIANLGDEEQRQKWLPGLMSGESIGAICFDGPDPKTWTVDYNDGAIAGKVQNVPGGMRANFFVIGVAGGRLVVADSEAISDRHALDSVDRTRRIADLSFNGKAALLADNVSDTETLLDAALVLLAADAFGGASHCLETSTEYAKTREQFGQPIGAFQGIKFQLADMAVDVEPCRGLYWYAAHAFDHIPDDSRKAAAMAKAHICDVYRRAARMAVEIHGGIGYTWEHDIQIYLKRSMFDFSWLGVPSFHFLRQAELSEW